MTHGKTSGRGEADTPRERRKPRPLDPAKVEELALAYVARFATSAARLERYLVRKLRERGWSGPADPPVRALVERMASLGYVDDRGFATARAAALGRRGYGERRVSAALRAAGIEDEDSAEARETARETAWQSALRFAERRRIGPSEPGRRLDSEPRRHQDEHVHGTRRTLLRGHDVHALLLRNDQ